jgi:uncharacterized protein
MAKKPAKTKPAKKQAPAAKKKAVKPAADKSKKTTKSASSSKPSKKAVKPASKPAAKAKSVSKPKPAAKAKPVAKAKSVAKAKPVSKVKPVAKAKPAATAKVVAKSKPVSKAKPQATKSKSSAEKVTAKAAIQAKKVEKPIAKPLKSKEAPKKETKSAKKTVEIVKPAAKTAPVAATPKKVEPQVQPKVEIKSVAVPQKEAPKQELKKEIVKTVEQQLSEKEQVASSPAKSGKSKEELFVPKYQLPAPVETVRPMRPKPPVFANDAPTKPVANPVYVPSALEGKPGIKFAPMAVVEKPKEKEKPNKSEEDEMISKASPRLAFNESDDKKGISVEAKLRALYAIQLIDSRIDKIHAMRGELPLEVQDLEDDLAGLQERIKKLNEDLKNLNEEIVGKKNGIKNSEALIKKYKEQLNNVKNNREFDSLNKEIEYQELEIQLHNKKIREFEMQLNAKKDVLASAEVKLTERENDLSLKRNELNDIIGSTEKEEKLLRQKSDEAKKLIEERLISAYERIRSGAPNGMAVVPIEREASAGSFIQLPPQKQLDVAARKRVIVDEHSGRILVDAELAREEQEKMEAILANELK